MEISIVSPIGIYLIFFFLAWAYLTVHIIVADYSDDPLFDNILRTAFIGVICLGYPFWLAIRLYKWIKDGK